MTVFYKLFFWKKAVLLQIYISIKKNQLTDGTVFLHNIISHKMPNKYTYCTVKKDYLAILFLFPRSFFSVLIEGRKLKI